MAIPELERLEFLAEVDGLLERLRRWADTGLAWTAAVECQTLVRRLTQRAELLRQRIEAPLVVATLGGSGTGKSALVNALAGAEVVRTGRQRPTTNRPTLVCRPGVTPEMLGIDRRQVDLVECDGPGLAQMVLVDCPDPDTSEAEGVGEADGPSERPAADEHAHDAEPPHSNLARLRRILPHCDVLLVTATQQKYRSGRVADELRAAAPGAHVVMVQTHADQDADIRGDWQQAVGAIAAERRFFFVDSLAALADARAGLGPRGDFAALGDLLTRQLAGSTAARVRRDNFLDLALATLASCRGRLDAAMPKVEQLGAAIAQERARLGTALAVELRSELLASRRPWESRLVARVTTLWGFSPFALVLRIYQGLGGLLAGAWLYRARTPTQLALWGATQGALAWQRHRQDREAAVADRGLDGCWPEAELRSAAIVLEGYVAEAGLPREAAGYRTIAAEAQLASLDAATRLSATLDGVVADVARRQAGWFTRSRYEILLVGMLGLLLFRLAKNFFYDSWLADPPTAVWGLESYAAAAFWLVLWCILLLWAFLRRLRGGLRREIDRLTQKWTDATAAAGLFTALEEECRQAGEFRRELERLTEVVQGMQHAAEDRPKY